MNKYKETVAIMAGELFYSEKEIAAGFEFYDRKNRLSHPPGEWDKAGRFFAEERSSIVSNCRAPSRRFPFSEMLAARTAAHCAEIAGLDSSTYVKRIALALERCTAGQPEEALRKLLTPGVRQRKADRDIGQ
ncbi:MAG: hypothetical protein ACSHWZ_18895 [Sulfitobacter sp.]